MKGCDDPFLFFLVLVVQLDHCVRLDIAVHLVHSDLMVIVEIVVQVVQTEQVVLVVIVEIEEIVVKVVKKVKVVIVVIEVKMVKEGEVEGGCGWCGGVEASRV